MTAFVTMTPIKAKTLRDKMLQLAQGGGYETSSIRYLRDVAIMHLVWNTTDIEETYPLPMFNTCTEENITSMTKDWDNSKSKWCEALIDPDKGNGVGIIYLVRIK